MEEFEQMWQNASLNHTGDESSKVDEDTPEYLIRDGVARVKILADLLINYYHAKHGEPLQEPASNPLDIKFHL